MLSECEMFNINAHYLPPRSLFLSRRTTNIETQSECTEIGKKACMWLREICSCSCLTALPGPAWVLLSKIYKLLADLCTQLLYCFPCLPVGLRFSGCSTEPLRCTYDRSKIDQCRTYINSFQHQIWLPSSKA